MADVDPEAGALRLGVGDQGMWYPVLPAQLDRFTVGTGVRLTRTYRLGDRQVRVNDTVLLVAADGGYALAGLGDAVVVLAEDERTSWPGSSWLRECLTDPTTADGLLTCLGGALPVTVDALRRDGRRSSSPSRVAMSRPAASRTASCAPRS